MTKRTLEVDAEGMANVLVLGHPIPRALSVVAWGANDEPAVSWKSADAPTATSSSAMEDPALILRTPPSADVIQVDSLSKQGIQAFVSETLDALNATSQQVLATPLSAAERSSRIRALHSQAGARVAAFAAAILPASVFSAAVFSAAAFAAASLTGTAAFSTALRTAVA